MNNFLSQLPKLQWKVFISTAIAMFIMVTLQYVGINPMQFLSPLAQKEDTFFTKVKPLLEKIPKENFALQYDSGIVKKAHATGNYDNARSYVALDFTTGEVLVEKNSKEPVSIASLTKIMSAIVALDLAQPSETFQVSHAASSTIPVKIGVVPGEQMTLRELLDAMLLTSANDAVEVIQEGIDAKYGQPVFIQAMNTKARLIGLKNTHFDNPQGFDGENYSTAEDLALLTHYAMSHYPLFSETVKKDYAQLPKDVHHKQFDLNNWNGLLGVYPKVTGVKIGNTAQAKKTTVVLSYRNDKPILAVLLGAPGILERDLWTAELLDAAYQERFGLEPVAITEEQLQEKYASWQYWH